MQPKEEAYKKIKSLVERFDEQKEFYTNNDYNETQTRLDFINPFWKALGWDIDNESGYAESYREVIHEGHIQVGSKTKIPDYSFRLVGGKRLFFLEAKKPSVVIKDDIESAYQIRRYGWSAKMPISVITDFEEFAIYDCSQKPNPADKASVARIKYLTFKEYLAEFDFIWGAFSKESVLKGSFDKYVQSDKNKKGTTTVDYAFLESLDQWRKNLAINIASGNEIDEERLNFAVQRIIDRIIFIRIAEDRGAERYGELRETTGHGDYYANLLRLFHVADQKYDLGIFDFQGDKISDNITIDNKVIKSIIDELYYPKSPYEFSVLSVEILGSAYERFLGKTISLSKGGRAVIEEKPEVRKAGGVYYTPQYIVDYIVKNTVGRLVEGKTPKEASAIKIVDPACGSGSFLLGAYRFLLNWHKDFYTQNGKPGKGGKGNQLTPWGELTTAEKKRILLNNIYGVDLDANAVEVTKLSLLLKCMEGETEETIEAQAKLFHDRVLPALENNVKSGNSLIDLDYYDNEFDFGEERKVKPFSWKNGFPEVFKHGGFDCVIGNPPYVKEYTSRETFEQIKKSHLAKYYQGKMDLWYFFACHGIDILKPNGLLGFIVPNNWVTNAGARILRNKVVTDGTIKNIVDFGAYMIFDDASIQTMILILEKQKRRSYSFDYRKLEAQKPTVQDAQALMKKKTNQGLIYIKPRINTHELNGKFLVFGDGETVCLLNKIQARQNFVLDAKEEVAQGIVAPQDFLNGAGEKKLKFTLPKGTGIFIVTEKERRIIKPNKAEKHLFRPFYTTAQLSKFYGNNENPFWVIYTTSDFKNKSTMTDYPNVKRHLDRFKAIITSDNKPYGLHRSREEKFFTGEKVISLRKCAEPTFTFTDFDCYVSQTFYILKTDRINQKYLTAFLNSKLVAFWLKHRGKMQGNLYQIDKEPILCVPIFDTSNGAVKDQIIKNVDRILQLNKDLRTATLLSQTDRLQQRIAHCENQIDALVYGLYGLTESEIGLIEGGN